jgi:hypothetical protein
MRAIATAMTRGFAVGASLALLAVAAWFAARLLEPDVTGTLRWVVLAAGPGMLGLTLGTFGLRGQVPQLPGLSWVPANQPDRAITSSIVFVAVGMPVSLALLLSLGVFLGGYVALFWLPTLLVLLGGRKGRHALDQRKGLGSRSKSQPVQ